MQHANVYPGKEYFPDDVELFKKKTLAWVSKFETACFFDSNNYPDPYSAFDVLAAADVVSDISLSDSIHAFEQLDIYIKQSKTYKLGFLSYDLKNGVEQLSSSNPDSLQLPELYFFEPKHLVFVKQSAVLIYSPVADDVYNQISRQELEDQPVNFTGEIKQRFSKADYLEAVNELKKHILRGDIYEVNFCQEFYAENVTINPLAAFKALNGISPTPFANFFKLDNKYIISATPERFLSKRGSKVISQPIKGTAPRHSNVQQDENAKARLENNEKERAENIMIVDLVRNDLTKVALPGTVYVESLCEVSSFKQVHQLISTVACEVRESLVTGEIIKAVFPMGSMTGAPKISAMQLIEKIEHTKRGVFSGSVGYIAPNGDFDFNVIIRTILYNANNKYLSFQVGSAITYDSVAEMEYEECLLKAKAILQVLN